MYFPFGSASIANLTGHMKESSATKNADPDMSIHVHAFTGPEQPREKSSLI